MSFTMTAKEWGLTNGLQTAVGFLGLDCRGKTLYVDNQGEA